MRGGRLIRKILAVIALAMLGGCSRQQSGKAPPPRVILTGDDEPIEVAANSVDINGECYADPPANTKKKPHLVGTSMLSAEFQKSKPVDTVTDNSGNPPIGLKNGWIIKATTTGGEFDVLPSKDQSKVVVIWTDPTATEADDVGIHGTNMPTSITLTNNITVPPGGATTTTLTPPVYLTQGQKICQ
jgi:hypothetical protein